MATKTRRYFGSVRTLPSGRHQARYQGPDGQTYTARKPDGGPLTFATKGEADAWLATKHADILRGAWLPPAPPEPPPAPKLTFGEYAETWLADRELAPQTRHKYGKWLAEHIKPTFGKLPIAEITPDKVRAWHGRLAPGRPGVRARCYVLVKSIFKTAVVDELVAANPCRIEGAGKTRRAKTVRPATLAELDALTRAAPPHYRLMVLLAAWCAVRFGELTELRRDDVDLDARVLRVRRAVVHLKGRRCIVKDPKSEAGIRDVAIPPHLVPAIEDHLAQHVRPGRSSLLFRARGGGCHIRPGTLAHWYYPARAAAGRPDLRWHDLRHTGATLAAVSGATLAELMARLGHSTVDAALIYQHAASERDQAIAAALSQLATAGGAAA